MDDSLDRYNQTRELINAAFEAGEINYQQYIDMNQKALRKIWCMAKNTDFQKEDSSGTT